MIEVLQQQYSASMPLEDKLNRVREFLQLMVLKWMHEKSFFDSVVFVGGTALRFLYGTKRFSEDLDFSLSSKKGYDFAALNDELTRQFKLNGLDARPDIKTDKTVHSSFMKFSGLLYALGLSPLKSQKFSVKLEVDTNPPKGAVYTDTAVVKTYVFSIRHHDLSSLYAGKLSACFFRKYTKGRDLYDFIWFLGKKIQPNYALLNNSIQQAQGNNPGINQGNIKDFMVNYIGKTDFAAARKDVERFLEDKNELKLFDPRILQSTVKSLEFNA
ncbi:MAG: nucleotidyl transferase AbiEii/AbiGii toxin family protein [Candidatus Omnitrophota bacterium]|nr:nucleotidyl transferase AbiEii/AbiGii toxin family protein [Candidatus Omnitrophota bacterium]